MMNYFTSYFENHDYILRKGVLGERLKCEHESVTCLVNDNSLVKQRFLGILANAKGICYNCRRQKEVLRV